LQGEGGYADGGLRRFGVEGYFDGVADEAAVGAHEAEQVCSGFGFILGREGSGVDGPVGVAGFEVDGVGGGRGYGLGAARGL